MVACGRLEGASDGLLWSETRSSSVRDGADGASVRGGAGGRGGWRWLAVGVRRIRGGWGLRTDEASLVVRVIADRGGGGRWRTGRLASCGLLLAVRGAHRR
ncbi:hypothetical protein ACLOJK_009449 [Asimina triloba]